MLAIPGTVCGSGMLSVRKERFLRSIASLDSEDPATLGSAMRDWSCEFSQLGRGNFQSRGAMVSLGSVLLCKLSLNRAVLHRLVSPPGATSFFLTGANTRTTYVQGRDLASDSCLVMNASSPVEFITQAPSVGYWISVSTETWNDIAPLIDEALSCATRGICLIALGQERVRMLIGAIDATLSALASQADALVGASRAQHLIVAKLRDAFRSASLATVDHSGRSRRRLAVERAREYIQQNLSEPIRMSELSRYAHIQGRSLQYGFRESLGMPPVIYVKMLRLGEAYRRLLSPDYQHLTISEVALDAGFRHLSQFSVDYKHVFMESPSDTRMRLPRAATGTRIRLQSANASLRSAPRYVQHGIELQTSP
jgi:AraC family transcriptional regulator, ethanolamine operon transcriptional activator